MLLMAQARGEHMVDNAGFLWFESSLDSNVRRGNPTKLKACNIGRTADFLMRIAIPHCNYTMAVTRDVGAHKGILVLTVRTMNFDGFLGSLMQQRKFQPIVG